MLLLSIHPRFARLILRGEKTVELRRRAPRRPPGYWIALYATSPERRLVGLVQASEVLVDSPEALWSRVEGGCVLSSEDYQSYFSGTRRAVGIRLATPIPLRDPLGLDRLRRLWPGFAPPRSFAYLDGERERELWENAALNDFRGAVVCANTPPGTPSTRDITL